ncbi:invasion associated locus B family protein [Bosea sp. NBC_00550]|uniref:invasion associated locus B family protein n=1 Tax=Bosea sp. NBC_00550 TaxID=2969621 RepID=UPI0022319C32|nr:invasion associated locus B family protein [Bosea sp. NBC_00550]UZF90553.1 invasion associated locus B family protein [Bosea sp. NBC_00550]
MHRHHLQTVSFAAALVIGSLAAAPVLRAQEEPAPQAAPAAPQRPAAPRPAPKPPAKPAQPVAQAQPSAPAISQPATQAATLPNGATAINETFGDWTVDCRIANGQRLCVLLQSQGNSQTGQRVFAIELRTPKDGRAEGTILFPFGMKLESGAVLRLDDKDLGQGLRFSTCMAQGCLLPISFPTVATDAMKSGKMLTVAALNLGNNEPVSFNVTLTGFAAALDRIAQIDK